MKDTLVNTFCLVCASKTIIVPWDALDIEESHRYIISCTLRETVKERDDGL